MQQTDSDSPLEKNLMMMLTEKYSNPTCNVFVHGYAHVYIIWYHIRVIMIGVFFLII